MSASQPEPQHCGRPMWAVLNRSMNRLPYNSPIWWCAECHFRVARPKDATGQPVESQS